jgi:uncharacterized repeat protein (TIGR01451 family)
MFRARLRVFVAVSTFLVVLAAPFTEALGATYTVVPAAVPKNMNNLGQSVYGCNLWSGGVDVYLSPFFNVQKPYGVGPCQAHDISNTGFIVGWVNDWSASFITRGCAGDLDFFSGSPAYAALRNGNLSCYASNGHTEALAVSQNNDSLAWTHFYVGNGGTARANFQPLGGPSTPLPNFPSDATPVWNTGLDINDAGDVVGYGYPLDSFEMRAGPDRAVLWRTGMAMDLGALGGDASRAVAVNNAGQVIGNAQIADGSYHAFLWLSGIMTDLGAFQANAINNVGQVAGTANGVAVLWENGVLTDLNSLIPPGSGWILTSATAINDQGQIGGQGTLNGAAAGFLLFPDSLNILHADLAVSVVPVGPARFSFNLTNLGPDAASGANLVVKVHDTSCPVDDGRPCPSLPRLTLSQGEACHHTVAHGYEANVPTSIWCAVGGLAVGQNVTGELVWDQLGELTELTLDATLFAVELDSSTGNNSTTVTVPRAAADIAVTMADSPDPVSVGQNLTYTAQIFNNGPDAAGSVSFFSPKPSSVNHVSVSASQGACQGTAPVYCNLGDLASGAMATVTMVATPTAAGTLNRNASAQSSSTDSNTANNSASVSTTVNAAADLAITITDSPDPVKKRRNLTYMINVVNNGPSTASGVTVTDILPSDIVFVSATPSQGSCSGTVTVTCNFGNLASGGIANVTIVIKPKSPGTISNSANVSGSEADPNGGNNSATTSTTVTK